MARILLIDDERELLLVLEQVLTDASHRVNAISDGRAVIEGLVDLDVDLVVTDINMPGTDGVEILMHLRQHRPNMRVIAMSGGGSFPAPFLLRLASDLGAVDTLQKPFPLQRLVDAVERILDCGRSEQGPDPGAAMAAQTGRDHGRRDGTGSKRHQASQQTRVTNV